jgi:hypothetical protein
MLESGEALCLALEAHESLLTSGDLGRQDLERHPALEVGVLDEVNDPHSARTELLEDLVMRQGPADHFGHPLIN